jgi:Na+-transporting methylmalonyl-CoA/oxaloacetate decarboxylase gamma subunit
MHYQIVGMLFVLGALAYLWLVVSRLGRTVRSLEQRTVLPAAAPLPSPAAATPPGSVAAAIDDGVVAAIAAAVAVMIRRPHWIVAVQPESSAQRAWSAEGRREIYRSHQLR